MMVEMPRPSSPTSTPQASLNSTSLLLLERLPTLSFRRWMWTAFLPPSGRQRGTKKQVGPRSSVLASTRWPSHIGAEKNHLWPVSQVFGAPRAHARGHGARACWCAGRCRPASRSCPCRPSSSASAPAAGRARRAPARPAAARSRHTAGRSGASAGCRPWSWWSGRSSPTRSGCACTATRRRPTRPRAGVEERQVGDAVAPGDRHHGVPGGMEPDLSRCARRWAKACAARARSGWRPRQRATSPPRRIPRPGARVRHRAIAPRRVRPRGAARVAGVDVVVLELGRLVVGVNADHDVSCAPASAQLLSLRAP